MIKTISIIYCIVMNLYAQIINDVRSKNCYYQNKQ